MTATEMTLMREELTRDQVAVEDTWDLTTIYADDERRHAAEQGVGGGATQVATQPVSVEVQWLEEIGDDGAGLD